MSDHNNRSLYENSEYPSRRQAPRHREEEHQPRKRKKRRGSKVSMVFKVLGTLLLVGLCTGALLCCFAAVYINKVIVPIADLSMDDFTYGENSIMYYQDKTTGQYVEMTTLLNTTSSIWVDLEDMPQDLIDAAVAIEDRRFWTHSGVDWGRTVKAVFSMFTGGDIQGGSTITQQLIKNQTGYNETTVKRKITEIVRAIRFTQNNSKEDTIERYLNIIPLGSGCDGVGAASLKYFGKPVSELTLAECASLISITNNPSKYGPYSFAKSENSEGELWDARQWNKYRQEVVLFQMLDQGYITQEEYDEAVAQELVFVRAEDEEAETEIYTWYEETVISDVREALYEKLGWSEAMIDQALQRGGLRIYTCYDPDAQAAVDAVYTNRENLNYTSKDGQLMQSAITVIDNSTGDVVAIAGQFGEKEGNLLKNYANTSKRQPGSSIKPLSVYAPALEMGKISPITILDDYPYQEMNGGPWPYNAGSTTYRGLTGIPYALKVSLNTIAVRILADLVTPEESFNFMENHFHIDLEEGREINGKTYSDIGVAPLAMGGLTDGVTTRDMAEAYATFPNGGTYTYSRTFTKVTHMVDGEEVLLLDNPTVQDPAALKDTTAYYMNTLLQGVFQSGGTAAGKGLRGMHCAGKTGTTNDVYDLWFVGYTPYYTAAVWMGYPNNATMPNTTTHVNLWKMVMEPIHEGLEDKNFPSATSSSLRSVTYCQDSGLLATDYCALDPRGSRAAQASVFAEDYPEGKVCTVHTGASLVTVCLDDPILDADGKETGLYHEAGPYCPEESLKEVCYPDYERTSVAGEVAGDEEYRYATVIEAGMCTVHTEETLIPDPNDPNMTLDPDDPNYVDPNDPNYVDPVIPGGPGDTSGGSGGVIGGGDSSQGISQDIPRT